MIAAPQSVVIHSTIYYVLILCPAMLWKTQMNKPYKVLALILSRIGAANTQSTNK